ncbi:MBL fold metallo-hydrolase [Nonomuraea lactucae]|uniref:MBL fold metallo-hydrolase n=1 Tax=Nonomuraea lactucae TaxID=2249762 RepID=UPI000DE2199F|nr:MBL fold metallo-hydrolase [Nonomuraea lactucae]
MATFQVGAVSVTEVVETDMPVPVPLAFRGLDGEADRLDALRDRFPPALFTPKGHPLLVFRSHVLRTPRSVIVLDTCWGNQKERLLDPYAHLLDTGYLDGLAAAGVGPADVDYVFCTHLHQDHVGWNTRLVDGAWVPTFPNATYLFVAAEYDHWTAVPPGAHGHDSFADSVLPVVAAGRHRLVGPGFAIDDAVRVEPLPGHTPGHCGLHVTSGSEEAVFTGDLFHVAYQFARPGWHIVSEHGARRATATREAFLARYADTRVRVVPAHFNLPAGGYLEKRADGYGFAPA